MFTVICLSVNESGSSSVCPSNNNYNQFTKFRRRIKHVIKGIIPSRSRVGVAFLIICISSDGAGYLNHFSQSDIFSCFNIIERIRFVTDKKTEGQMDEQTDKKETIYLFYLQDVGYLKHMNLYLKKQVR